MSLVKLNQSQSEWVIKNKPKTQHLEDGDVSWELYQTTEQHHLERIKEMGYGGIWLSEQVYNNMPDEFKQLADVRKI